MTQYAYFDSNAAAPSRVLGWYDTDALHYPNLPPASDLFEVTAAEWAARLSNPSGWAVSNGALVAYTPAVPPPTLAQQAAAALGAGLTITSTSTPALNGTYPADPATISYVNSEMVSLAKNGTFADGTTSVQWPDTSGALHTFSVTEFEAFAGAMGKFVALCRQCIIGASQSLPPSTATIP